MNERSIGHVEGTSAALSGLGALTYAFFPLAIPIVALTAVALAPFIVIGLALGVVAGPPVLLARWLRGRKLGQATRKRDQRELRRPSPIGASPALYESR